MKRSTLNSARLKSLTVLDPACGSGAFLITVLRYLVDAWHEVEGLRRQLTKGLADKNDDAPIIADILKSNIYGVDINAASVEIARLALWLHTARGDKPLSSLDDNIREGNSLIGPDFDLGLYDDTQKERVNVFDWQTAFPAVFERGGFDAVVGNPPYVKLQNFRTVHADMAVFLRDGRSSAGMKPYSSTQTGNFDIYLPFIEKGITLLNERGRLGYIAPSLSIMNEYGEGLRRLIAAGRNLERWIDFKSYQVFEESTTYTALQFFTKISNQAILVAEAPTGEIPADPWADAGCALPYGRQIFGERWLLLTGQERALIDRLYQRCKRLDDSSHTSSIFVGIQTSADAIYHLRRLGPGHYLCTPRGDNAQSPYEVEIEDELMQPLVSGAEAKRYIAPETNTYLLFPYQVSGNYVKLIDAATMQVSYPKAWAYLRSYERDLRARENDRMDYDTGWWGYNYPKNLDKQQIVKLIVAQTVSEMRVCVDEHASMYLNNVRVNGIVAAQHEDPWFLLGVLNSGVTDFVFRRIAKVKSGGFFEANKQFIAPLPIPPATAEEKKTVAHTARILHTLHTARRDTLAKIERRLATGRTRKRLLTWLFPSLKPERDLIADAPARLDPEQKMEWAEKQYARDVATLYDLITGRLLPGCSLAADFRDGELSFSINSVPVIARIFVEETEGEFIVAQWKVLAATFVVTENTDGKKLASALRKLILPDNPALVNQLIELEATLSALEADIAQQEHGVEATANSLYRLSDSEIELIGKSIRRTFGAGDALRHA